MASPTSGVLCGQVVKKEVERVKGVQAWEVCRPLSISFNTICADLQAGSCPSLVSLRQTVSQLCSGAGTAFLQGSTGHRSNKILKAANDLAQVSSQSPNRHLTVPQ